jgi:D-glycero-D-manno-heptose 1,7-bisphosphate phosphatase
LTANTPKPLLSCGGRPFLAWILRELVRFNIERVLLLAGHLAEQIRRELPEIMSQLPRQVHVTILEEPTRAGTGGALYHARDHLEERFLLMNGDTLFDGAVGELLSDTFMDEDVVATVMLRSVLDASRFGTVVLDGNKISQFSERPGKSSVGVINGGVYLFTKAVVEHLAPACSLERDILPQLASRGMLNGRVGKGYFIDIGVPSDFQKAQVEIPRQLHRPALFLDRDGVINVDEGWVGTKERFKWIDGARESIALATSRGWHVFIVTNQAGVARGFYDETDVNALHAFLREEVRRYGGTVDDIRYCPHHPEALVQAYRMQCECRKPAAGMIKSLRDAWELDLSRCVLVGDKQSDLEAASRAGVPAHLFSGGDLRTLVQQIIT